MMCEGGIAETLNHALRNGWSRFRVNGTGSWRICCRAMPYPASIRASRTSRAMLSRCCAT